MVEIAPGIKYEKYQLDVYEDVNAKTNTNDTVIDRCYMDTDEEKDTVMQEYAKKYPGYKYKLTTYFPYSEKRKQKSKIGIFN